MKHPQSKWGSRDQKIVKKNGLVPFFFYIQYLLANLQKTLYGGANTRFAPTPSMSFFFLEFLTHPFKTHTLQGGTHVQTHSFKTFW
jgi:hypothetical protein